MDTPLRSKAQRQSRHERQGLLNWFKDNDLSIVALAIFLLCWVGQSVAGHSVNNQELRDHGRAVLSYWQYLGSAHFWEATTENWESEYLQLTAMVVMTMFLKQKGSAESKSEKEFQKRSPQVVRKHRISRFLYENSLGLALTLLFIVSFSGHVASGFTQHNLESEHRGQPKIDMNKFLTSSQLWFESMQNWQSEFLAVYSLTVLSIWLRQKGSAESKPVEAPNERTGK